jgi:hypothetical protein
MGNQPRQVEFRGGPWDGQKKSFATDPGEIIEVPAHEGGPFTYQLATSVGGWQSSRPVRIVYEPHPSMDPNA